MTRFVVVLLLLTCCTRVSDAQTLAGIDVLQRQDFRSLEGQRVGLITNHTGTNLHGDSTVQLLHESKRVNLVALFSPEHGFAGHLDQATIGDQQDQTTGLKIYSLYGDTRVPTAEMLGAIDTLVFDIQDIGTRFYTYISTMGGAMRAAAENGKRFVVLDRPNPIDGVTVSGPVLDSGSESFVGYHTISVRHGMTIGELARMFRAEWDLPLDLSVVELQEWDRTKTFEATGRRWINPSPNMRSLTQAILYPGVGLLETTNVSVGRGTDTPFEVLGAPWIDALKFAERLRDEGLGGVTFVPIEFTPDSSKHSGELCGGVNIVITDHAEFDPLRCGLLLAVTLRQMYPSQWDASSLNRLLSNQATHDAILGGASVESLMAGFESELSEFRRRRTAHLIYPVP